MSSTVLLDERVPRERFAALIEEYLAVGWTVTELVLATGISDKTLRRVRTGALERCSRTGRCREVAATVSLLDRFLCGVGEPERWVLPAEQGGFEDVYFRT